MRNYPFRTTLSLSLVLDVNLTVTLVTLSLMRALVLTKMDMDYEMVYGERRLRGQRVFEDGTKKGKGKTYKERYGDFGAQP